MLPGKDRSMLSNRNIVEAVTDVVELLDKGRVRVAQNIEGKWVTNDWIKRLLFYILLFVKWKLLEVGMFEFHDKIPLKHNYAKLDVRVVPHAIARHGSFLAPGVILMPSYVNIGAYVDSGTMVDTWATVGSCAQIGKKCTLKWWSWYWRSTGTNSSFSGNY